MSDPDDRLDALLGAYREEAVAPPVDEDATRQRIFRSALRARQRRKGALVFGVAAALLLSNATTFAWFTGRLDPVVAALIGPRTPARAVEPAAVAAVATPQPAAELEPPAAPPRPAEPSEIAVEEPERASRVATPSRAVAPRAGPPPTPEALPPAPAQDEALAEALAELASEVTAPDAERVAFERAHGAHFRSRQYAVALERWEAYLRDYPRGRFVPEARWNATICLLRLDLSSRARAELTRFATGEHGPARREEASRLLRAMDEGRLRSAPAPTPAPTTASE